MSMRIVGRETEMSKVIIQCDTREKENQEVIDYFEKIGQPYFVSKVPAGDYINFKSPKVAVDLKASLLELEGNLTRQHQRFVREIETTRQDMGCNLVVLIREPLTSLEDVKHWSHPRTKMKGEQLYKIMKTMEQKYGILWRFCTRENAGAKIIQIIEWYDKYR